MLELEPEKYLALQRRRRDAVHQLSSGLREAVNGLDEYLAADIDAELEVMEAEPPADPQAVARLTEDLMYASSLVQTSEENMRLFQNSLQGLSPEVLAFLDPFMPIINGVLLPMVQAMMERQVIKATRRRDDIQAELMAHEDPSK